MVSGEKLDANQGDTARGQKDCSKTGFLMDAINRAPISFYILWL